MVERAALRKQLKTNTAPALLQAAGIAALPPLDDVRATLNEAFCGVYNAHCPRGEAGVACPDVAAPVARHWSRKPVGRLDPRSPLVSYWDEAVGNITAAYKEKGMWEDTLMVLTTEYATFNTLESVSIGV